MSRVHSFPPIVAQHSRILILGSMPGVESLRKGEYYAHPRNLFWRILGTLLEFNPALSYTERVEALQSAGISVWDVLQSCTRQGSLDSSIEAASIMPNNFSVFYEKNPAIARVYFNGSAAEQIYRRKVLPALGDHAVRYMRLPSTSPANASINYAGKLDAWREISQPEVYSLG